MENERETLLKAVEDAKQKCEAEHSAVTKQMRDVIEEVIKREGLESFTTVRNISITCIEIETARPDRNWGHTFSIYYSAPYGSDKRMAELNVGTFGSFSSEDKPEVNFYVAAGKFAASLSFIQEKFDSIDFSAYRAAQNASWEAGNKLNKFDEAARQAEEDKLAKEIEAKLVLGAKIKIGTNSWDGSDKIDEISKIGYKRIYFSKHLKPLSKEEVIKHFLCTYGTWTFVA